MVSLDLPSRWMNGDSGKNDDVFRQEVFVRSLRRRETVKRRPAVGRGAGGEGGRSNSTSGDPLVKRRVETLLKRRVYSWVLEEKTAYLAQFLEFEYFTTVTAAATEYQQHDVYFVTDDDDDGHVGLDLYYDATDAAGLYPDCLWTNLE
jgi:hypothetical protein